jgi:hypothetical protein
VVPHRLRAAGDLHEVFGSHGRAGRRRGPKSVVGDPSALNAAAYRPGAEDGDRVAKSDELGGDAQRNRHIPPSVPRQEDEVGHRYPPAGRPGSSHRSSWQARKVAYEPTDAEMPPTHPALKVALLIDSLSVRSRVASVP